MIEYQFNVSNFQLDRENISEWLENVILKEKSTLGEIGYIFCDDKFLLGINQRFLQHDTYTDIITFPSSQEEGIVSGEIYISVDRVKENVTFSNNNFEREMDRVIVHGVLHLLGYKDKTPEEAQLMRQKEDYYLSMLS
ncbi:MAG: rRNA maturation RNase YbeY [Bacteroidales bacterium]|nr:rRNA maturation RNase YbeY [Bacteroidales bacterium]